MKNDLVSVVITTYSRPDNLCEAIESVLNQTYAPIEIIVVDDNGEGTTNQQITETAIRNYIENGSVKYIKHQTNLNGAAARNTGFRYSQGEYINFLDDDDALMPNKIQLQIKELRTTSESVGAAYCNMVYEGRKYYVPTHNTKSGNLAEDILLDKCCFNTSTILFKRNALLSINGWDDSFVRHQDWEIMLRFFRCFTIILIGKEPLVRRFHVGTSIVQKRDWVVPTREKYLKTFAEDIAKLKTKNAIYQHHYLAIATYLFCVGEIKDGVKYYIMAVKLKPLNVMKFVMCFKEVAKNYIKVIRKILRS